MTSNPRPLARRLRTFGFTLALVLALGGLGADSAEGGPGSGDADAVAIANRLATFVGNLDQAQPQSALAPAVPVQSPATVQAAVARALAFADPAASELTAVAASSNLTISSLDAKLDDLDGNGSSASDVPLPGVTVDINGTIDTTSAPTQYLVTLTYSVTADGAGAFSTTADGLTFAGQALSGTSTFTGRATFQFRPGDAAPLKWVATNPAAPIATARLTVGADVGATNPAHAGDTPALSLDLGIMTAQATGLVDVDVAASVSLVDANHDGVVDSSELNATSTVFGTSCAGGTLHLAFEVTAPVAGLAGQSGQVTLDDADSCNGSPLASVELGPLAGFRSIDGVQLVNGLGGLTTALGALQQAGDLDIPFVEEDLSSFVHVNERLVSFFVTNGLTDPAHPMDRITIPAAMLPSVDTLQEVVPKLATALGVTPTDLALTFAGDAVTIDVEVTVDPPAQANAGTIDVGDQLYKVGMSGLTGSAKATVDPSYTLDLTLGIDLRPGIDPLSRFFFGVAGQPAVTIDAPVSADLDLNGTVGMVGVHAVDTNAGGTVPLLVRGNAAEPMVKLILSGLNDGRLTLSEVSGPNPTLTPVIKSAIPSTTLNVTADVTGTPIPAGTVAFGISDISLPIGPAVVPDPVYRQTVLPFAYDADDPAAGIGLLLRSTQDSLRRLRGLVTSNPATTADLPLVGQSLSDLDPVLAPLAGTIDDLVATTATTTLPDARDALAHTIAAALGLPPSAEAGLVTIEYQPGTSTARAALLAHLALGICTTDRTGSGCSRTAAPLAFPLNLSLGTSAEAIGMAGLESGGSVTVGYDSVLHLDVGVELPTVVEGAANLERPHATNAPRLVMLDTSSFTTGVGAAASGTLAVTVGPITGEVRTASADLGIRFRLAAPSPTGARLELGTGAFNSWLSSLVPANVHDAAQAATCNGIAGSYDACAVLPVYLNNNHLGDATFKAPDLRNPGGWTFDASALIASVQSQNIIFDILFDGLHGLSETLGDAMHNVPDGSTIPLLGDQLSAGADVLGDFVDGVVTPAADLANRLRTASQASALRSRTRQWFLDNTGPGSPVPILRDTDGNGTVNGNDVTVTLLCDHSGVVGACADTDNASLLRSLEVRAKLGSSTSGATPSFDIGFPGLRLSSDGHVAASVGITYNLAFGVDTERGFYVPTAGPTPELQLTTSAGLPNVPGPANDLQGDIAFLPFTLEDAHPGNDVQLRVGVDLGGGDSDGHLDLQHLDAATVTPSIAACSNVSIDIATALGGPAGRATLPNIAATLGVVGGYSCDGSLGAPAGSGFTIRFDDVSIDVGSLVGEFIRPVVDEVHQYTEPLEPAVDAIRSPVPGLADLAGEVGLGQPTWYDLLEGVNQVNGGGSSSTLAMIDRVATVVEVVQALDADSSGSGSVPLGSFTVDTGLASSPTPAAKLGQLVQNQVLVSAQSVLDRLHDAGIEVPALDAIDLARDEGGFSFPAYDNPSSLFGLLIGQDVTLVRFDAGELKASRDFHFAFGAGIVVSIGGRVSVEGHFVAGYDTAGIRDVVERLGDDDPTNDEPGDVVGGLAAGLYIEDLDAQGKDQPEISLEGELGVGVGVGVPFLNVGIEGGIDGVATFDLRDPDADGKVRITEIADLLSHNPDPLCIFTGHARFAAALKLVVEATFFSWSHPIANIVIYDQPDVTGFCANVAVDLADRLDDGTLVLVTTATNDSIFVQQTGDGRVRVSARGKSGLFTGVTRVFADGADGADDIHVTSTVAHQIGAVLCGGGGADTLEGTAGPAQLYGDDGPGIDVVNNGASTHLGCAVAGSGGNDFLTGGEANDSLDGGSKDDTLFAGGGNDGLVGGAGNDVLRGGYGNDTVEGGGGADTSEYVDHDGGVLATAGGTGGQIGTAESDTSPGVESLVGSPFNDDLRAASSGIGRVEGGAGDDVLRGAGGDELLLGQDGNDELRPGLGTNRTFGGRGDDTFVNGRGADIVLGEDGFDTADYSAATTAVRVTVDGLADDGPAGEPLDNVVDEEHLIGGSAADVLVGASSNDRLEGRGGNDNLFGGGGDDSLEGGADDDRIEGNPGADVFLGGAGFDFADYSGRSDPLTIRVDGAPNDGGAPDRQADNVRTDVEHVLGGANDDYIVGRAGLDDLLEGGPADDVVIGNNGNDRINGQDGDDVGIGGSGSDTITGGPGDDELSGRAGGDTISGDAGNDAVSAADGDDTVDGGTGADTVRGGKGADDIDGGDGNDLLYGDEPALTTADGADTMRGGNGSDRLYGAGGEDALDGGAGNDTASGEGGDDVVNGGAGRDHLQGGTGIDAVNGDADADVLNGNEDGDVLHGGPGDDVLRGDDGNDTLLGDEDDDVLSGGRGDDLLDGGTGGDQLVGNVGVDTADYHLRAEGLALSIDGLDNDGGASDGQADTVDRSIEVVLAGSGDDTLTIATDLSFTLDGGDGNDTLTVASFVAHHEVLRGGAGQDRLTGGLGDDLLVGGLGNDTELGGAGDDSFDEGPAKNGKDDLVGGDGFDQVDYSQRSGTVTVTFDGTANDGNAGEKDNARPDLEAASVP